ncbi:hypothetical protein F444_23186 [Phytophthora nicotianae P1976]|uniref:Uncharacterized protein n=1 Tax=Phytophthora nicotianae P1976 TaxID=1317066 RepID=A0A080YVN0_PHYNI|nr:hypothetical protein F444_23186 [Phytophthora nicotianae P1976]
MEKGEASSSLAAESKAAETTPDPLTGSWRPRDDDSDASSSKRPRTGEVAQQSPVPVTPSSHSRTASDVAACPAWMPSASEIANRFGATSPPNPIPLYVCSAINDDAEAANMHFDPSTNQRRDYYTGLFHELRWYASKKTSRKSRVPELNQVVTFEDLRFMRGTSELVEHLFTENTYLYFHQCYNQTNAFSIIPYSTSGQRRRFYSASSFNLLDSLLSPRPQKPSGFTNVQVCAVFFRTILDGNYEATKFYRYRYGTVRKQVGKRGSTNLMNHVIRMHPDYQSSVSSYEGANNGTLLSFVDRKSANIIGWLE